MTVLQRWRSERDCFWSNRYWNKGQVYELTAEQASGMPQYFTRVGTSKQSTQEARLVEINREMGKLSARRNQLRLDMTGFNNSVIPELNQVEREFAKLDLERYELTGK